MDNEIIRAYLRQKIIHLAFTPSRGKDQSNWLRQYNQSLKDFWELDQYPSLPSQNVSTIDTAYGLSFEYSISSGSKFVINFKYNNSTSLWIHDADHSFFEFPQQVFLTSYKQEKQALQNININDMEAIIDGLLCHPRVHQHIKFPIDVHEIRIGGGIDNPFVFLFHLRYQLCLVEEKREAERQRLINLFFSAMNATKKNKKNVGETKIPPNELMKQPE